MKKEKKPRQQKEKVHEDIFKVIKYNTPLLFLMLLVVFITYGNTLSGEFLTADDVPDILQNPKVLDFGQALRTYNIDIIIKAGIYKISGPSSFLFHLRSLTLHTINGFLVFMLFYYLTDKTSALYTSLLFLVHPITSEAVSWISAGIYLIYAFFALITFLAYIQYKISKRPMWLYASAVIYITHLISLQSAWILSIPLTIVVIDFFILDHPKNKSKLFKADYLIYLIPAAVFLIAWLPQNLSQRVVNLETLYSYDSQGNTSYIKRLPYTIYKTLELYILPNDLTIYHEGRIISEAGYFLMSVVSIASVFITFYLIRKKKKIAGYVLVIASLMLPVFIPYAYTWFIADRYLYLGTAFFCALVLMGLKKVETVLKIKNIEVYITIMFFGLYASRTYARTYDWKTNKELWHATQAYAPLSPRVYNNLGDVYSKEKDFNKAVKYNQIAIELNPNYVEAIHNLGFTYMQMGDFENAKLFLNKSISLNPNLYQAYYKLGLIEYYLGNKEITLEYMKKTLEINPNVAEAIRIIDILEEEKD